jgi:serine/threonine protein kinase
MNKQWSKNLRDLFSKLLNKDPEERMNFSLGIKEHPWFNQVKWDDLLAKKIIPPFVPILTGECDVSNFAKEFTKCSVSSQPDSLEEVINYEGFSFERENSEEKGELKEKEFDSDGEGALTESSA